MAITFNPSSIQANHLSRLSTLSFGPKPVKPSKISRSRHPLQTPFTIIIDKDEKLPYAFTGLNADAVQLYRPLIVTTARRRIALGGTRLSIDYSLEGFESVVGVERKSHEDFCNTLVGHHRRRFERKLSIINATFSAFTIVVEAEWSTILFNPPDFSNASPKNLFRTVIAWQARYPRIHWLMLPNRRLAEQATFRILEKFWKENFPGAGRYISVKDSSDSGTRLTSDQQAPTH